MKKIWNPFKRKEGQQTAATTTQPDKDTLEMDSHLPDSDHNISPAHGLQSAMFTKEIETRAAEMAEEACEPLRQSVDRMTQTLKVAQEDLQRTQDTLKQVEKSNEWMQDRWSYNTIFMSMKLATGNNASLADKEEPFIESDYFGLTKQQKLFNYTLAYGQTIEGDTPPSNDDFDELKLSNLQQFLREAATPRYLGTFGQTVTLALFFKMVVQHCDETTRAEVYIVFLDLLMEHLLPMMSDQQQSFATNFKARCWEQALEMNDRDDAMSVFRKALVSDERRCSLMWNLPEDIFDNGMNCANALRVTL